MRVMVATEGAGEYSTFPKILSSAKNKLDSVSVKVVRVSLQPDGPVKGIAKSCATALKLAKGGKYDLFVLVLDREEQLVSPGNLATRLSTELSNLGSWPFRIEVVYKDRTFENWLIADLGALKSQRARYRVTDSIVRQVQPDKADRVVALALLKSAVIGRQYEKIEDGKRIAERLDLDAAAKNSRSLRHFLHILGYLDYRDQCLNAIDAVG